jgi:hypothetical protein
LLRFSPFPRSCNRSNRAIIGPVFQDCNIYFGMVTDIFAFSPLTLAPCSPLRGEGQPCRRAFQRGDGCVSLAANFPPDFGKTTVLLAFLQICRENEAQPMVSELQPIVCLLLPFYFPVV